MIILNDKIKANDFLKKQCKNFEKKIIFPYMIIIPLFIISPIGLYILIIFHTLDFINISSSFSI